MFDRKIVNPSLSFRPSNALYRPLSQPMNDLSTYSQGFTQKFGLLFKNYICLVKRPEPIRQKTTNYRSNQPFSSQTIQQTEFTQKYGNNFIYVLQN